MNQQQLISKAMSILGARKTPAKAAASRKNGKKGGRPRTGSKIPPTNISAP